MRKPHDDNLIQIFNYMENIAIVVPLKKTLILDKYTIIICKLHL